MFKPVVLSPKRDWEKSRGNHQMQTSPLLSTTMSGKHVEVMPADQSPDGNAVETHSPGQYDQPSTHRGESGALKQRKEPIIF
uniref:(California timema) hypothetical protein n=1 Tax=Timema californicum TaxID=61474 RepID=A0A7R9J8U4_TIMCA|nr:unnamed protein product [Timema californicum]